MLTPEPREGSMKHIVLTSLIFVAITGSVVPAQPIPPHPALVVMPLRLSVRPDSRLWLEGSSNVRDWRCDATTLDASIDLDDTHRMRRGAAVERVRRVQVRVPTYRADVRAQPDGQHHVQGAPRRRRRRNAVRSSETSMSSRESRVIPMARSLCRGHCASQDASASCAFPSMSSSSATDRCARRGATDPHDRLRHHAAKGSLRRAAHGESYRREVRSRRRPRIDDCQRRRRRALILRRSPSTRGSGAKCGFSPSPLAGRRSPRSAASAVDQRSAAPRRAPDSARRATSSASALRLFSKRSQDIASISARIAIAPDRAAGRARLAVDEARLPEDATGAELREQLGLATHLDADVDDATDHDEARGSLRRPLCRAACRARGPTAASSAAARLTSSDSETSECREGE